MSRLYSFSEDSNTCRITDPRTPRYWYNYLWSSKGYCAQISQVGHGKSEYIDEKANVCRVNNRSARYVYFRDEESGVCWNPGLAPLMEPVEDYLCEHSIGYTRISSVKDGIAGSVRYHVPADATHEVWTIRLENRTDRARQLSVFSAASFDLDGFRYPRYYEMYRAMTTECRPDLRGVYCGSRHPFAPHGRYNAFLVSAEEPYACDGELSAFCGSLSTLTEADTSATALFQRPDTVLLGKDCENRGSALFILGGVLQHKVTLLPGERKTLHILLGVSESDDEVKELLQTYGAEDATAVERVQAAFDQEAAAAEQAYYDRYATLRLHTPDKLINDRLNLWVQKQVDFCIVGKKGVRDNLQIAVALLNYRPKKAREEILECLRHQFAAGHAVLTWYPYDDTRYSDQPFWILWAVCELIKETGDFGILFREIEWQDGGSAMVLEHMKAAVRCLEENQGVHGLPKILYADWNDALNITTDPEAESVMLAEQYCLALREFANLLDAYVGTVRKKDTDPVNTENGAAAAEAEDGAAAAETEKGAAYKKTEGCASCFDIEGLENYSKYLRQRRKAQAEAINRYAWDGAWYKRALSEKGDIGSSACRDGKIYVNAQTWALLADIVPADRKPVLLKSMEAMEQDFGYPICDPPYAGYDPSVGRMSGMLPGLFENGAVYCHATAFKVLMDAKDGRGDDAVRTFKKIVPDSPCNPSARSGAEPYVFTNCYASHPGYYGRSYGSWTTGTSAWCLRGIVEGVLGVRRDYDGLHLCPSLPGDWEEAAVERTFRGTRFSIRMERTGIMQEDRPFYKEDGVQPQEEGHVLYMDGVKKDAPVLTEFDGKSHQVLLQII